MHIDTEAIRRLRDHLLEHTSGVDRTTAAERGSPGEPGLDSAIARRMEPFAETMFLVMMADGQPDTAERHALLAALEILTGSEVSAAQLEAMLDRFAAAAARDGIEGRIEQLGAWLGADQDERETAFTLAAAIALADDHVHVEENQTLLMIREYYGVSARRMAALLETID
jgi:uncharacterized tellurite resistance protein B-like protein